MLCVVGKPTTKVNLIDIYLLAENRFFVKYNFLHINIGHESKRNVQCCDKAPRQSGLINKTVNILYEYWHILIELGFLIFIACVLELIYMVIICTIT